MRLDSSLRWNDEDSTPVIPSEQRETQNPGAYNRGKGVLFLSRKLEATKQSDEVVTSPKGRSNLKEMATASPRHDPAVRLLRSNRND